MLYQYTREPLTAANPDRLSHACQAPTERLVVWTLLDTGLRVSALCGLTAQNVLWQQRQLRVQGKGGPHGKKTNVNAVAPIDQPDALSRVGIVALHGRPLPDHDPGRAFRESAGTRHLDAPAVPIDRADPSRPGNRQDRRRRLYSGARRVTTNKPRDGWNHCEARF